MQIRKEAVIILSAALIFFLAIGTVSAVGYDNPNLPKIEKIIPTAVTFNNNTGSVNRSDYWGDYFWLDYDLPAAEPFWYNQTIGAINWVQSQNYINKSWGQITVIHKDGTQTFYEPSADTDAARGTALTDAVGNSTAGDYIFMSGNTYDIGDDNGLLLHKFTTLQGAGMYSTIIKSGGTLAFPVHPIVYPNSSTTLSDFSIIGTSADKYQYPIGCSGNEAGILNSTWRNIYLNAITDGIMLYCKTRSEVTGINLDIKTNWDTVKTISAQAGQWQNLTLYDTRMKAIGLSPIGTANQTQGLTAGGFSNIICYNCDIEARNAGTGVTAYSAGAHTNDATGTISIYNSRIRVSNSYTGGAYYALKRDVDAGAIFVDSGTTFDVTNVSGTAPTYVDSDNIIYDINSGTANLNFTNRNGTFDIISILGNSISNGTASWTLQELNASANLADYVKNDTEAGYVINATSFYGTALTLAKQITSQTVVSLTAGVTGTGSVLTSAFSFNVNDGRGYGATQNELRGLVFNVGRNESAFMNAAQQTSRVFYLIGSDNGMYQGNNIGTKSSYFYLNNLLFSSNPTFNGTRPFNNNIYGIEFYAPIQIKNNGTLHANITATNIALNIPSTTHKITDNTGGAAIKNQIIIYGMRMLAQAGANYTIPISIEGNTAYSFFGLNNSKIGIGDINQNTFSTPYELSFNGTDASYNVSAQSKNHFFYDNVILPIGNLFVKGNTNITGNVYIDGNVSIKRPYGMFSSIENQVIALADTAYAVNFTNIEDDHQVYMAGDNRNFSFGQTGDYLIELSAIVSTDTNNKHVEIWVQKNGVNIPRSNTHVEIENAGTEQLIVVPFIIDMNMTDRFRVMYASDDAGTSLVYTPATAYSPESPSIIMTISKISEITP